MKIKKFMLENGKNKREWKAIFYFNNGNKYDNEFKNDQAKGKENLKNFNDENKFEGKWKNDLKQGFRLINYNNGDKYEDEFKKYLKEGKGILYCNDGDKYDDEWKYDEKGIIIYYNNEKKYKQEIFWL